jgi:hypothetical protein
MGSNPRYRKAGLDPFWVRRFDGFDKTLDWLGTLSLSNGLVETARQMEDTANPKEIPNRPRDRGRANP